MKLSTALVQFDGTLSDFPFIGLLVPAKVEEAVSEISWEFASGCGLPDVGRVAVEGLHDAPSECHLDPNGSRDSR